MKCIFEHKYNNYMLYLYEAGTMWGRFTLNVLIYVLFCVWKQKYIKDNRYNKKTIANEKYEYKDK